jgi:hypothetical protein
LQGATSFVKHYPIMSFLYILGLGLMCFCSGLMPSEEASDEYSRLLREADFENNQLDQAELKYAKQNARYQSTRGFLGFSCDATCNREYQAYRHHNFLLFPLKELHSNSTRPGVARLMTQHY